MNIGPTHKHITAAQLTPQRKDGVGTTNTASLNQNENTDSVKLSAFTPSLSGADAAVDGLSVSSRLADISAEVSEKENFMSQHEHVPNQVLVRLKNDVSALSDFAQDYGTKVLHKFDLAGLKPSVASSETLLLLDLQGDLSVAEAMVAMGEDPRVSVVESNDIVRAQVIDKPKTAEPNDLESSLWGLDNQGQDGGTAGVDIGAKKAWETTVGSRTGPIVAVIDSGVDIRHPDLKDNIFVNKGEIPGDGIDNDGNGVIDDVSGYNAAADSNDPKDDHGHGTHVAGTIGAVGNNGKGIVGVNQEAQILPIRFLSESGAGTTGDAIKALVYASRTGARVVNNSWGGNKYNQLVFDAMADSESLFVCAAGNEAYDNDVRPVFPASYDLDNVISVTAHDRNNNFPRFANRGETTVDLAAPGVAITSTFPNKKYESMDGTSMASPHVAGVATLIATQRPDVTNEELKFLLMHNLEDLPEKYGSRIISGGRLNAGMALEQDTVNPGAVSQLKLESAKPDRINVSWLATGDDGNVGKAAAYDIRYTTGQFKNDDPNKGVPFAEGLQLGASKPKPASQKESLEFSLIPSGKERSLSLGVVAVDNVMNRGGLTTLNLTVPAAKVAIEDNADNTESTAFQASEHWGKVAVEGRGLVFTDSPVGDYPADRDAVLLSKPFSLKGFKKPVLHFDAKVDVEKKHDEFVVEIEKDGWFGKKWKEVGSFDGLSDWKSNKIDISDYTGKKDVKIRFRLKSDSDRNRDGVYLDNIVIAEQER